MSTSRREHIYRVDAIVLGRFDLGEVDRILTLFTRQHGKIKAIAKGIRRPQSRLAPHLELFNQSRLMLAHGRELDVVTSAETIDVQWALRTDLDAFGHASYLAELLNQFTEERQENEAVYDLMAASLRVLAEGIDPFAVSRHFELSLLSQLGFRPELYRCVRCEHEIEAVPNALSARLGGMLCPNCRDADIAAPVLSVNAQKYIRSMDRSGLAAAVQLQPDPQTALEIEHALSGYARHHAERDSRSLRVIRSIREWSPDYGAR